MGRVAHVKSVKPILQLSLKKKKTLRRESCSFSDQTLHRDLSRHWKLLYVSAGSPVFLRQLDHQLHVTNSLNYFSCEQFLSSLFVVQLNPFTGSFTTILFCSYILKFYINSIKYYSIHILMVQYNSDKQ